VKTKTKICGLTTADTMAAALAGGADYVGLVFFAKSPRNVSLQDAAKLAQLARGKAQIVALVVNADDAMLTELIEHVAPDVLQLHGSESPERVADIKIRYGRRVWKALPVETAADAERAFAYVDHAGILFDAKPPKDALLPGGNGHAFDWSVLTALNGRLNYMLSGGLNPDNVAQALRATSAWGVDVSSGVERAPGVKDAVLIQRFLRAVNGFRQ
jgi:phosphoribosylanthranilate isomerase